MGQEPEIRIIWLQEGSLIDIVNRLKKGTKLRFQIKPSLHGHKVELFVNHPICDGKEFSRHEYHKLNWTLDSYDERTFVDLKLSLSGSFEYYFLKNGEKSGRGFFLIDPELKIGPKDKTLDLDGICCQTVLPKCLGPFSEWPGRLEVTHQSGYNMIHFTPVQELGKSNSSYSISNQLKLNPIFGDVSFDDVQNLVQKMKMEWGVLSICDVVFNHTANETPWLRTHPECGYNMVNSPHLRPAYLLDAALHKFSDDVANDVFAHRGLTAKVTSEEHLNMIRILLKFDVIPQLNVAEFYCLNIPKLVEEFSQAISKRQPLENSGWEDIDIIQDPQYKRNGCRVDIEKAIQRFYCQREGENSEETQIRAKNDFQNALEFLNKQATRTVHSHLENAVENVIAGARYERIQSDGPKIPKATAATPLIHPYFEKINLPKKWQGIEAEEKLCFSDDGKFILAHNGWVMNDDPLRNFADASSNVYLRRELIVWGDSVKLRYGDSEEDCPFLWQTMRSYAETTAKTFHGVRLDNCHSTPIHVAEYLIDAARNIRPDLYVVAELFTNSDSMDNIFVNRLGITSLIREAMSAHNSHEEGRLVHRYGGRPVGAFRQEKIRPLIPSIAHALFMDQTHDNPSPIERRSIYDVLPTGALVAMANCATGSNRGLDELVPHHIHVVDESRSYSSWEIDKLQKLGTVCEDSGIMKAKRALNLLHAEMANTGFSEVFVDQREADIVAVTRHQPDTHKRIVLVAYTAFSPPDPCYRRNGGIADLSFEGHISDIIMEAQLHPLNKTTNDGVHFPKLSPFKLDPNYINAIDGFGCSLRENIPASESKFIRVEGQALKFVDFQPGSVIAFRIDPPQSVVDASTNLLALLEDSSLNDVISPLSLSDLNRVLYRCEQEENDETGRGAYEIPNYGKLVYCGLQGIMSVLANVSLHDDTGHPLCHNLRAGNWLMEYTYARLKSFDGTKKLGQLLQKCNECLMEFPRYLVPRYFDIIIQKIYKSCIESSFSKMSTFVKNGSPFVQQLALGSIQCCGICVSGSLPWLSPDTKTPGSVIVHGKQVQNAPSLSAGLPHFSTGYMRNWGRDTFISLPGLLIHTGRFEDARWHILAYASVLRHGLIPNLLDGGINARYNCRDATWFWLYAIKVFVENAPQGCEILQDKVYRMWPNDFGDPVTDNSVEMSLEDVMQESIQRHFQGINFIERNAGTKIDAHMTQEGFHVTAGVDRETGFVSGGNSWNCGTWMDKMGSSEKAGNRGIPATPRDGSAVELVGLSAAVINFLAELHKKGKYSHNSVSAEDEKGNKISWTYNQWYDKIRKNFERYFWIPLEKEQSEEINEKLVHRRGIYKDSLYANSPFSDYQLRPNFLVAMVTCPELFSLENAITALNNVKSLLLSRLGLRTLDPSDWNYNGNYDNGNDSADIKVAHGFNYHNGPEWLWPVGFYIRAYLFFFTKANKAESAIRHAQQVLSAHWQCILSSPWKGLPELTNKNGTPCHGSCQVQAWSHATILEALKDLRGSSSP